MNVFSQNRWLPKIAQHGVDLLLPPVCPVCRGAVFAGNALCAGCWSAMEFITGPVCKIYGTPFAYNIGDDIVSAQAIADPPPFGAARSAVRYGTAAKALVHGLKYHDRMEIADLMIAAMHRAGAELLPHCQLIVPVPLHRWRLWRRRFNQSQVLAAGLSKRADVPIDPFVLQRRRKTRQQVGLSANEREINVRGAFLVPADQRVKISGLRILLVDDVYTSGATAKAASRELLRAGAAGVDVVTFANVCQ